MRLRTYLFFIFVCLLMLLKIGTKAQSKNRVQLKGQISVPSGEPVQGISIQLNGKFKRYSDKRGVFRFNDLTTGKYHLRIHDAYFTQVDTVVFIEGPGKRQFNLVIEPVCWRYSAEIAKCDILSGHTQLLLSGGISPAVLPSDSAFEARYRLRYHDFGCVSPDGVFCQIAYNRIVFDHLDSIYGSKWRKEVRKDVIGFKR